MSRIYVSIGSNINPEENIRSGILDLKNDYPDIELSSVYRSKAIGFEGDDFYNLVAAFESDDDVHAVVQQLKCIEDRHNRTRNRPRFSPRTLDIDLLLYDDLVISGQDLKLPRDEITQYAFVLYPLVEIAGQNRHPVTGITYKELWQEFDSASQRLERIDFQW